MVGEEVAVGSQEGEWVEGDCQVHCGPRVTEDGGGNSDTCDGRADCVRGERGGGE